jgi:CRISPR-associated protein Cas2
MDTPKKMRPLPAPAPAQDTPLLVVAYDIADDRKRRRLFKLLRGYGAALQESVFLCRLGPSKQALLAKELLDFALEDGDRLHSFKLGRDGVALSRGAPPEPTWIEE